MTLSLMGVLAVVVFSFIAGIFFTLGAYLIGKLLR